MNAELPAFDPNQVDAAFAEALEEDGLPPLYPNQPRWAFEDGRGGAEAVVARGCAVRPHIHARLLVLLVLARHARPAT